MKINFRIASSLTLAVIIIFAEAGNCAQDNFLGQLTAGFGYINNLPLRTDINKYKKMISGQAGNISGIDDTCNSLLAASFNLNFRWLFSNDLGLGISSGIVGLSNNAYLYYRMNLDVASPGQIEIKSLMLPQNLNLYYRLISGEKSNLTAGIGLGDCIIDTKATRKIRMSRIWFNQSNTGGVPVNITQETLISDFATYAAIKNSHRRSHNPGFNAVLEFSFLYFEQVYIDAGFQGYFVLTRSGAMPGLFAYIGVTERSHLL